MIIKKLSIKNFGKIHDRTLELSPGINVLYGENESGKTTLHTFVKSMLYGITRQRGKAAKNDIYNVYEPWENPISYGGTMWFEKDGDSYRVTRNFHKTDTYGEILREKDGAIFDAEKGALQNILGGVSEVIYDNTVSVAQLKSVTGNDLVRELQNYMASYQGTGDSAIDLGRASQMLKMMRKGFQVQKDKHEKELEKERNKIHSNIEYVKKELWEIKEKAKQLEEKQKSLRIASSEDGESGIDEKLEGFKKNKICLLVFMASMLLAGCIGAGILMYFTGNVLLSIMSILVGTGAFFAGGALNLRIDREVKKWKRLRKRLAASQEKIQWNRENIKKEYTEKERLLRDLQLEYQEYQEQDYMTSVEDIEINAINLAMETIQELSGNINHHVGNKLRKRTSEILSEITNGKYQEVLMDEDLKMMVNVDERIIPLERLSRGTMEQIYFALRMAAGELLCGKETFPVILDDVFGMYDEERLALVLRWLHKENRQIIISTCHKREMEILEKENIPYQKLVLS